MFSLAGAGRLMLLAVSFESAPSGGDPKCVLIVSSAALAAAIDVVAAGARPQFALARFIAVGTVSPRRDARTRDEVGSSGSER